MTTPQPPVAPVRPHTTEWLGHTWNDDYFWLQNREDPAVLTYLEAENAYTEAALAPTAALQAQLYREMRGRIKESDLSVPVRDGDFFYYVRTEEGQQYPIYCRKHGSLDGPEELLLDVNQLAEGQAFCRIGAFAASPDHRMLAYSVDTTGAIVFTLYVKNLETGELLAEQIPNTAGGIAWANDNRTLYYTVFDDSHRPYQLYRHTLGSDPASDTLLLQEDDEKFYMGVEKTRSDAYLIVTLASMMATEVYYASADDPTATFTLMQPRQPRVEYYADHHGERFLIITNDEAENFRLMEAPVANPMRANWRELLPHRSDVLLEGMDLFADFMLLYERKGGLKQIHISQPDGSNARYVNFPEPAYTFFPESNPDYAAHSLRFSYSSLVTPRSVVEYGLDDDSWTVLKQQEIPSGYDPALYESARIHATAPDGVQVPMSIVYRKGLALNGSNPCLLYGYGSYGYSMDPIFSSNILSLLDRGFVYAMAHIRGGSELGRAWYEQGRLLHKKNTFTDFITCAEHLVKQNYTAPARLAMMGGSAGGLLVSAVANMRPELFRAVVAKVAYTNVINAMLDPNLPLTVIEYEQWGDPHDPEAFAYMWSYSPYDQMERKAYPHFFVTGGLNDLQVPYWDP
ncbi:MAG: S9 family peptidase, partial [Chloroflexaceae bacterium]|nr:S9 family peptidase [Chloroflexaceae bacterium]